MFSWKVFLWCALSILTLQNSYACTGIVKKGTNGDCVYARTLEFGHDLIAFDLLFVPREIDYTAQSNSDQQQGIKWKNKYAYIGFNPFGMPIVADGLNEKGLACGAFYLPGWAEYQQTSEAASDFISNLDFVSWVLGNFATVDEAIAAIKKIKVIGLVYKPWGIVPPLHYMIVDENGKKAVIEYVQGNLDIYDASLETITNSPSYDWHLVNARNYIGLRALNKPSIKIEGNELASFGQGSGAIGLPGDFTPPSRFIRAAFLNQVVLPAKDGLAGVERAFKILNQFDIPKGAVQEVMNGKNEYEETQWTSASDLANRLYYYHTATNRVIQFVNLKELDANAKTMKSIPINKDELFINVTSQFKL